MHRTMTQVFFFILLALGSTSAQNDQKKLPAKGAATKLPTKGIVTSQPPPPGSLGWTQWGGPHRNFTSDSKGLANSWPPGGPQKLWSRALGDDGYSGIAVEGNMLYTMYRRAAQFWQIGRDDQEVVVAGREYREYDLGICL